MARSLIVALAGSALALAGCPADDDYMSKPPGSTNPPGGNTGGDAGVDASDGGVGALRSKVCVVTDLRQPTSCSPNNNVGVTVRELGTANQTMSIAGGFFDLSPTGRDVAILEVGVGGSALIPSIVAVNLRSVPTTIPVPLATSYNGLTARLGVSRPDGTGDVAAYFLDRNQRPLPGITVEVPAGGQNPPFLDINGDTQWVDNGVTGPYGASLLFGVPAGTASVVAYDEALVDLTINGVPVVDGRVTFVTGPTPP